MDKIANKTIIKSNLRAMISSRVPIYESIPV